MRALVSMLSAVVLSCVLGVASGASAQSRVRLDPEQVLTLADASYDRELASIDSEATAATALYVTGVTLHVLGIGTMAVSAIAGFCISFSSSSCSGPHEAAAIGTAIGAVAAGLGLIGIFVGVGLDVDSGHRRRALGQRPSLELGVAPSSDGGMLSLQGSF